MAVDVDFLAHLRAETARFRDVLAPLDPAARVPSCPDWTADDLLWHLGEVQHFWGVIVRDRLDDPGATGDPERADGHAALLAQFDDFSALLDDSLATTADDVRVWTWVDSDQSVGFVRRRQAHEALMHRVDAELAAGERTDIDRALASDGVLEVLEWMYAGVPPWATHALTGPIGRVTVTDAAATWLVQLGSWSGHSPNSGKTYEDQPTLTVVDSGEPGFEVSGPAVDLDLWLWNRPTAGEISVTGDAAAFVELIRGGVQ